MMYAIGIVTGALYVPPLVLAAGGWLASRVSVGARRWIHVRLFG